MFLILTLISVGVCNCDSDTITISSSMILFLYPVLYTMSIFQTLIDTLITSWSWNVEYVAILLQLYPGWKMVAFSKGIVISKHTSMMESIDWKLPHQISRTVVDTRAERWTIFALKKYPIWFTLTVRLIFSINYIIGYSKRMV